MLRNILFIFSTIVSSIKLTLPKSRFMFLIMLSTYELGSYHVSLQNSTIHIVRTPPQAAGGRFFKMLFRGDSRFFQPQGGTFHVRGGLLFLSGDVPYLCFKNIIVDIVFGFEWEMVLNLNSGLFKSKFSSVEICICIYIWT